MINNPSILAVVTSPFQLICLKEYINNKKIEDIEIILICDKKYKLKFIKSFDFLKLKPTIIINRTKIISRIKIILYSLYKKKIENLILGNLFDNYHLLFLKSIKPKNVILIDDGMGSVNQLEGDFLNNFKFSIDVFTVFKIANKKKFILNRLTYLKHILESKNQNNSIYIIGQPLTHIISVTEHKKALEVIINRNKNSELKYFPHRRENFSHLASQFIKHDIEVVNTDEFFEIFLIKKEFLPKKIISFYSTVLLSSSIMLKDSICNIKLDSVCLKKLKKNISIRNIYDYFETNTNIRVYDL